MDREIQVSVLGALVVDVIAPMEKLRDAVCVTLDILDGVPAPSDAGTPLMIVRPSCAVAGAGVSAELLMNTHSASAAL